MKRLTPVRQTRRLGSNAMGAARGWFAADGTRRQGFAGAEELRMVRALVHTAWLEARRHGVYRAAFRGFRIEALRWPWLQGYGVTVEVTHDGDTDTRIVLTTVTPDYGERVWMHAQGRKCEAEIVRESPAVSGVQ